VIRGLLVILGLAAAVLILLALVGLPTLATVVIRQGVVASGLDAPDLVVTVTAEPPTDLLGLHADVITITGTEVTLDDVDLAGRRAGSVDGVLAGVAAPAGTGSGDELAIERIDLSGGGSDVRADVRIGTQVAEDFIARRMQEEVGISPTLVRLSAPDRLAIGVGPVTVDGRLVIGADGSLRLETGVALVPSLTLIDPGSLPIELTSVAVTNDALLLGGRLEGGFGP
jgi:hypothetical protein